VFQLPPERIWVSVYEEDEEAATIWRDVVGVPPERIKRMGAADNFWASGPTGVWVWGGGVSKVSSWPGCAMAVAALLLELLLQLLPQPPTRF
jgi:hypothetical protein